jgi:poly(A) polymerase
VSISLESPQSVNSSEPTIDPRSLSPAAVSITQRLQRAGYEAYLVGGCVRDLLLGGHPKDYDVATSATPEQVREVFRRARIIGRRFKIVHVREGREVIEVTTFRHPHESEDDIERAASGRILDDNEYGDLESDALRRDFTVNALYYDPTDNEGIDLADGLSDMEQGVLRIIGDPEKRLRDDPVRVLRAIRFRAKLKFVLEPATETAVHSSIHLLGDIPPARLFDEVLKLFQQGFGLRCGELLQEYRTFEVLFPVLAEDLKQPELPAIIQTALQNTDERIQQNKPVIAAFLFAALLWLPVLRKINNRDSNVSSLQALIQLSEGVIAEQCQTIAIPRRISTVMREIWEISQRMIDPRPKMVKGMLESRRFRAAYDFLLLRELNGEVSADQTEWWTRIQELDEDGRKEMIDELRPKQGGSGRKRRPRRTSQQ